MNNLKCYTAILKDKIAHERFQIENLSINQLHKPRSPTRTFDHEYHLLQIKRMNEARKQNEERGHKQHEIMQSMKQKVQDATQRRVMQAKNTYFEFKENNKIFQAQKRANQQSLASSLSSKLQQLKLEHNQFITRQQAREKQKMADVRVRRIAQAHEIVRMRQQANELERLYSDLKKAKRGLM